MQLAGFPGPLYDLVRDAELVQRLGHCDAMVGAGSTRSRQSREPASFAVQPYAVHRARVANDPLPISRANDERCFDAAPNKPHDKTRRWLLAGLPGRSRKSPPGNGGLWRVTSGESGR
jgi:hypothetical protein